MARRISLKPCATSLKKWAWRVNLPAKYTETGKRQRHFFPSKREAQTFCEQQRIRIHNYGCNSSMLTPGQQEEATRAFERLAPYGVTLNTVVADFIARHDVRAKSVTFKTLFDRFTESKKNRSGAYLRGLKYTLPRFAGLHDRNVCDISPADIDGETDGMTPAVRNAFLRNLRAVFNFGVKRGWVERNPIAKLDFETVRRGEIVTLTPDETEGLMRSTEKNGPDLLPYHAVALFAGVRPHELQRLEWRHIDLIEGHIEITAAVSKTGRRRIIDIEPNLAEWLNHYIASYGAAVGNVTPTSNLRGSLRAIRKAAGLNDWTQDVMRHSYASYWLAQHGDINRLTLYMGHESANMLWKHYHKAAKRKDAESYWKIMPSPTVGENVAAFSQGLKR
jgi:Site-specific recombinase XerC